MFKRFKEQKGAVAVMAALVMVAILGFTAFSVDVGMVVTSRNQLQNTVDSAALAAASKLAIADHTDIINTAQEYAGYNKVLNHPMALQSSDIQIVDNADMALRRVEVTGNRTSARGNPIELLFAKAMGYNTMDVTATATGGLLPLGGTGGVRPWAVRDRCLDDECTEYVYPDEGELVTLKFGPTDDRTEQHWFAPVDMPPVNKGTPVSGSNAYRDNVKYGHSEMIDNGDILRVESGNMAGPTVQGVNYLVNQDQFAYWDSNTRQIMGSSYTNNQSPRVIKVAFYDPDDGIVGSPGQITVTRLGSFFLEGASGLPNASVTGRFVSTISSGRVDVNSQSRVFGVVLVE